MKTLLLVAFGVVALGWLTAAQKPEAAKPAPAATKQADPKQDRQNLKALGYSSPQAQKGAVPVAPVPGAGPKPEPRAGGPVGDATKVQMRNVAGMVVNVERAHRDRVARLERLRQIYEKAGAAEKLEKVSRLRAKEHSRYEMVMSGYEKSLGPELFAKLRTALDRNAGRPPAAPAPTAVPPAEAAPGTPKQERGGARQKGRR